MTPETPTTSGAWIPSDTDFGSRLALVRHRMGWNVKEAARECGVPAASWRLWEVDGALPRNIVTIAMAIATRTGCDLHWLLGLGIRTSAYGTTRVLVAAEHSPMTPKHPSRIGHRHATRPVRQTRPLVGVSV